jgi:hypothetical protein
MKLSWRFLTVVVAIVAGSLLLAACGGGDGGDGEEVSLDEYFQQFDAIEEGMAVSVSGLDDASEGIIGEDLAATQDYVDGYQAIVEQGLNDVRALNPPSEAKDAQDEFVTALSNMVSVWGDLSDRLADVGTTSEMQTLLTEMVNETSWLEATDRFTEACRGLQGIADENGIEVTLDCE